MGRYLTSPLLSAKRWVAIAVGSVLLYVMGVAGFNYSVDPFGDRNWVVQKYYKPIVHERSEKYTYLFHQKNLKHYDCLILGSSRVMSIDSSKNSRETCYNFGIHVANNPEKLFILEEWLKHAPLKTLYLGNELYNVHAQARPLYLDPSQFTRGSEGNYLSVPTLLISFKALRNQLSRQPQTYFMPNGMIRYSVEENRIGAGTFDHSPAHFHYLSKQKLQDDYISQPFSYEAKALEPLKRIKSLCDRYHIKLYPFITPMYTQLHSDFHNNPELARSSQQFRKDLSTVFGAVYDFDTNNSFNADAKNFYDPVHYRPAIGKLIYERFSTDNGYGIIIKASDAL